MVEIFQYIHDYTELHKEMNNLKKYNIFKKKKIVNKMVEIEEKIRAKFSEAFEKSLGDEEEEEEN